VHQKVGKGKLVKVRLKDGSTITGRFKEPAAKYILLEGQKPIRKRDIRTLCLIRPGRP
jgi:hypothetical protein